MFFFTRTFPFTSKTASKLFLTRNNLEFSIYVNVLFNFKLKASTMRAICLKLFLIFIVLAVKSEAKNDKISAKSTTQKSKSESSTDKNSKTSVKSAQSTKFSNLTTETSDILKAETTTETVKKPTGQAKTTKNAKTFETIEKTTENIETITKPVEISESMKEKYNQWKVNY
jgi:hypothetical protein